MKSARQDGRGHWPSGKRRNAVDPSTYQSVLQRVRSLLETKSTPGLVSRHEIARQVGVSDRTVRRWLSGEDVPEAKKLELLRRWLEETTAQIRRRTPPERKAR